MNPDLILTLDVDWAPDFVIDAVARQLIEHGVRATWFVTHMSAAIESLASRPDLFELGIHPNFQPGSTHGNSPEEVLSKCLSLAPNAVSMRTHGLVQSTRLLMTVMETTSIRTDVSLFMPGVDDLKPFLYRLNGRGLWRLPYFWEDDVEMLQDQQCWSLEPLHRGRGLRVLDFHPIHIYLNSTSMEPYERLKRSGHSLQTMARVRVDQFVAPGSGSGTLFSAVVRHLATSGSSRTIADVIAELDCEQVRHPAILDQPGLGAGHSI